MSGTIGVLRLRNRQPESTVWISQFPYRDRATSDPPVNTLQEIVNRERGVVVFAWIEPGYRRKAIRLNLRFARHFLCCDGSPPDSFVSEWDMIGAGPKHAYEVTVRVFLPLRPWPSDIRAAKRALTRLRLPPPR